MPYRYLIQRRRGWYVRVKVPKELQKDLGRAEVVKSLQTRDLTEAQERRWAVVGEIMNSFRAARKSPPVTRKAAPQAASAEDQREAFRQAIASWKASEGQWKSEYPMIDALLDTLYDHPEGPVRDAALYILQERQGQKPELPKQYRMSFREAADSYLAERRRDPNASLTGQTLAQAAAVFRLFESYAPNVTLTEVSRTHASEFLDKVARLSPLWGRSSKARRMGLEELLSAYGSEEGLSNRTLNRFSSSLLAVWRWAERRGHWSGENPWRDQFRKAGGYRKTGWLPFSDQEVLTLLAHCEGLPVADPMHWVPLIGAHSGMRSGEICSLRVTDVRQETGVWFFDITAAKTEAGVRRVPIHSRILQESFLDYRQDLPQDGHLFPALKPGGPDGKLNWYFSRRFVSLRRALGIDRERVGFHSFRKAVGSKLEQARIPESEAVQVLGHEKLSMSYTVYSLGVHLQRLREIVEAISYGAP